jgi:NAD(P)-dependent dehydrogenase (short-subunit alcohol dehydrogenase family)
MEATLKGKVAVVSGASHGLGEAIATELVTLGADVVLLARNKERLDAVAKSLRARDSRVLTISCDVSKAEQVQTAARQVIDEMGRVDILINNAGIPAPRTFEDTDFADWDQVIGVNLSGVFYLTRALWEALTRSETSYVLNIAGTAGLRGGSSPAYGSAKFGLTGLTRAIAASGKAHNLRATVLYPGGMDTGWRGAAIGVRPRAETMDPQEVARLIGYLLSTPPEFVVNEAVLNPIADTWM